MSFTANDIMQALMRLEAKVDLLVQGRAAQPSAAARTQGAAAAPPGAPATGRAMLPAGSVAADSDLDSQWGDVEIKKDPTRWPGQPLAPIKMSAAPADYLEVFASQKDWQAEKEIEKGTAEGEKYAGYSRKDAARARGWAQRAMRSAASGGGQSGDASGAPPEFGTGPEDEIPFLKADAPAGWVA